MGKPLADWAFMLAEFEAEYAPHKRTIREFCLDHDLPYSATVNGFERERRRAALGAFRDRNKPLLLGTQKQLRRVLEIMAASPKPEVHADFMLKAYEKLAERVEPDPKLGAAASVKLPPLFASSTLGSGVTEALTKPEDEQTPVDPMAED